MGRVLHADIAVTFGAAFPVEPRRNGSPVRLRITDSILLDCLSEWFNTLDDLILFPVQESPFSRFSFTTKILSLRSADRLTG